MTETPKEVNVKRRIIWQAIIGVSVLALFISAAWYLTSPQFREFARKRVVAHLEDITGGRVELGSFQWNLSRLEFDVRDVTIHGLEGTGEVPYAHADHLLIRLKILSWMGREIGLRWLQIERPVVHLIVYPDGHTNQPVPRVVRQNTSSPVQTIFELSIHHAELNDGQLIINEQNLPLDFAADNLHAAMDYVFGKDVYEGSFKAGNLNVKYASFLPAKAAAEAQFRLSRDVLEISSFHIATAKSKMEGSAKLANFSQPVVDVSYRATLDGKELAPITRTNELRGGVFDLNGTARYERGQLASQGKLAVRDGSYSIPFLNLANVDATADYAFDPEKLTFNRVVARVFGGNVRGDITVVNWLATTNPKAPEQIGTTHLRVDGMPVGRAADAFSTKQLNFGRLNLAGTTQGTVDVHWRVSPMRAVANINLEVVPSAAPQEGQLPVTGSIKASFDAASGRLRMDQLDLVMPDIHAEAAGVLGSTKDRLKLSLAVNDLTKLRPMLTLFNEQNSAVSQLAGTLNFDGTISGKISAPAIEGKVEVSNFDFPLEAVLPPPANPATTTQPQPKRLHIDSGSAEVAFSPQQLILHNGSIRRQDSSASFDVNATLFNGQLTEESHLAGHLVVQHVSLSDLQQMAGYNYPVSGTIFAKLNVSGTKAAPEGSGHFELVNGSIYGEPVKSITGDAELAHQELWVRNLKAVQNGAQFTGSGRYNLQSTEFRFQAIGSNFQLANIHRFRNFKGTIAGVLDFNATGSGTAKDPIINASARLHNVVVNGERVGDVSLTAITQGDALKLTARSNFQSASLTMDGSIKLHDRQFPATLTAHFSNFDFMPYLQPLLQGRFSGKSFSEGTLLLQGSLREPKQLTVKAEIPKLTAETQGIELRNSEPIQLSMANGTVRIDSFKMVGPDTQMDLRGTVRLIEDSRIRVRADGRMNLKLAQSFDPDINSSGFADFNVSIGGVLTKPTVQGEIRIANGAVNLIDFPNGLSNINGSLVFTEDRLQVQSLSAHTGGGDIHIGGFVTYPALSFNLTAQGQDIRLRYPQGISSTANLDLKLTGTMQNATLSGDVTITRFGLNSQFDLAVYLAKSTRPMEIGNASLLNNLHFNVHVTSTPELQVQSSLAKLAGNVDLRVRGTGTNPVLLGRVNVTEGQISFNGANYRLERGDVVFTNPTKTEPNIDVAATTRVRDYDITLEFHGPLNQGLSTNYRSDPPLPQADIINLLAFGRTREEAELVSQTGGSSYTGVVGNAILGQALNSAVSDRVQKLFGVSRVKIAPDVSSTQTNPTAQVTIEQQVSNKVTITYVTNLAQSSQQSIFVEYNINPQLSLIAGRDQYGVVSFDVKMRQRKR